MTRIVSDEDGTVVIEDRPLAAAIVLGVAVVFFAWLLFQALGKADPMPELAIALIGGTGCFAGFNRVVRFTRLTLRPDGHATLATRTVRGQKVRDFVPGQIKAELQTQRRRSLVSARAILVIDGGNEVEHLPLSPRNGPVEDIKGIVARINDWRRTTT
ncbi:MAG: hypothetical protein AAGK37_16345 [Pseudomonadota bacterium]